jgi:hypothetical protein
MDCTVGLERVWQQKLKKPNRKVPAGTGVVGGADGPREGPMFEEVVGRQPREDRAEARKSGRSGNNSNLALD